MRYLLLFILFPTFCYGQGRDSIHHSLLKLNLISLLDINTFPTVQIAYERKIHNDFSFQGEAGYQFYSFYRNDTSFVRPSGFKVNVELRYFNLLQELQFPEEKKTTDLTGLYAAANIFYRQSRDNRALFYYHSNDTTLLTDYFYGTKKNWGFNLLLGYQFNASKKVVFDVYAGIGAMMRKAKEYNLDYNNKTDTLSTAIDFNITDELNNSYLSTGNGLKANLTLGIRLGIRL